MINPPKDLNYARWISSKFDFKNEPVEGEWLIEVIEEEPIRLKVEWVQIMLAYKSRINSSMSQTCIRSRLDG